MEFVIYHKSRVLMNIHAEYGQLTLIVFGVISCCMLSTVSYNL